LQNKKQLEQKRRVNMHHSISYGQFQPEVCDICCEICTEFLNYTDCSTAAFTVNIMHAISY